MSTHVKIIVRKSSVDELYFIWLESEIKPFSTNMTLVVCAKNVEYGNCFWDVGIKGQWQHGHEFVFLQYDGS